MDLHEQRDLNKFSLAAFGADEYNRFDFATDQIIEQLRRENYKSEEDYDKMEKIQREEPDRWYEWQEKADRMDINLDAQMNGYMMDVIYRTEEMIAIMEMKIIYAYKHLEINIKKLIAAAYPTTNTKDFYKWEALVVFLKSKGIKPDTLSNYREVIELREVNNKAKHRENIHQELQHIKEFEGQNYVSFESLEGFYRRVKNAPKGFLQSLAAAIYNEIYEIDDLKLNAIADSIILRMDKEQGLRLVELIKLQYQ